MPRVRRRRRERASANAAASNAPPATCSVCSETKPSSEFSKTQLRRGDGARRCARCARDEASGRDRGDANAMKARLMEAREASERAEATNARDKLAVFAREASLEATAVTGLEATFVGGEDADEDEEDEDGRIRTACSAEVGGGEN